MDTFSIYLVQWYWIYINFILFLVIGYLIIIISSQFLSLLFLVNCYYSCYDYFNWLQLSRLDHSSSKRDETRVWIIELTSPNPYGVRLRSCYLWIFVEICLIILDISCPSYLLWYCFYVPYILSVVIFSLYFISYMVWYSFNAFIFQSIIFTYLMTVFIFLAGSLIG